jgi:hypothetical protein
MVIPELKTAECTVVEGESNQAQQAPQRVQTHRIDVVPFPEPAEFIIVAFRTISVPLEEGEESAIVVSVRAAMRAVKSGAAKDAAEKSTALPFIHLSASDAACIDSTKKQTDVRLVTKWMCKEYHEC